MLSILIPSSNEVNIHNFIEEIELSMVNPIGGYEIIIASDAERKGKGWALRRALENAKGDLIAFIDGDGDIQPRMLWRLFPFLMDFDIVVGSKKMTRAPLQRKIITHLSRLYIRILFGIGVDTQTGIKLFHREALREWKTDGFGFDIEILRNAKRRGMRMIEIPVDAEIKEKMTWRVVCKTLIETVLMIFR